MITEDYVSFERAKLLKEKGFDDEYTNAFYDNSGILYFIDVLSDFNEHPDNDTDIAAPTLYVAMKWLRKVHKLCITIIPKVTDNEGSGGCLWDWVVTRLLVPQSVSPELFESYEQACEVAIKYCLENLI